MSAAARPSYTPRRNHSSRLTVIVFVAVLFLVGRSVGAELKLGLHTLLLLRLHLPPLSRQRGSRTPGQWGDGEGGGGPGRPGAALTLDVSKTNGSPAARLITGLPK